VARNALNFFEPYEHLAPHHENQLTRALGVVLRMSPMAHTAWLRHVDPGLALHRLPKPEIRVQRAQLLPRGTVPPSPDELQVISVFMSGERVEASGPAAPSDRGQVLDAVVLYGAELAIAVENKLGGDPDDWQARAVNLGGLTLALDERPRALLWRDVLDDFAEILRADLVAGAEAGLIEDFLEYVEAYFDQLMPFNNLAVCHGAPYRQQRRCRTLLTEVVQIEARQDRQPSVPLPGASSVARAYLAVTEDDFVDLTLYPADTLSQARAFYSRPNSVAGLQRLAEREWLLDPNFHFGYVAQGLVWTWGPISANDYLDLWARSIDETRQIPRADWEQFWHWLESEGVASPAQWPSFRQHFVETSRQEATPRPGLRVRRRWPLDAAEELDRRGRFVDELRAALSEVMEALEEQLPAPAEPEPPMVS
jgi:hypothetical protein